mmetsp:Transcript_15122/g.17511  ORF Transcript_15122/g.17511 Transcript_15122/m.17511 type:complete len:261 (-) Transcript_15122:42-824(-)
MFSLGIILFIMVSQANPFYKAEAKDPFYKFIYNNRCDFFWKIFEKTKPVEDYYSQAIKDLISCMLATNPLERPSLSEVKESEWYKGELPTAKQVFEEFTDRKEAIARKNLQAEQGTPEISTKLELYDTTKVYRSTSNDSDDIQDALMNFDDLVAREYIPEFSRYTKFFSTSPAKNLLATVLEFGEKVAKSVKINNKECQIKLTCLDEKENNIEIIVDILKHNQLHCVEVTLDSGDIFEFKELYSKLMCYFGGHANALESD